MASEEEIDHNVVIRNILANLQAESGNSGGTTDCVAQLIAAAVVQFGNTTTTMPTSDTVPMVGPEDICSKEEHNFEFNPNMTLNCDQGDLQPTSVKRKPMCIKFPIELRKRIISMRKEGKKCMEVAKELHISVSGAQKVWERFLATGMVHDKKPSTYAGRPRKYTQQQEQSIIPSDCPGENIEIYETIGDQPEFMEASTCIDDATPASESEPPMIVTYTGNTDIFVEGALDVPGATVEIVETDPQLVATSEARKQAKKRIPEYRQQLLMRLLQDCPLSTLKADPSLFTDNPHVTNLSSSINKPLYMEYILGHPFGKVPFPQPFDGSVEEASIILSDPVDPIGKEMLASLGYSTKVYFNACCKPSPLFDSSKILSSLPFSIGPGHLAQTMQAVLQLLIDLCIDPAAALDRIPTGNGLVLIARIKEGVVKSQKFSSPGKLSDYWNRLYSYASLLECCENFLSANKPSAPCLMCHPFESVVRTLEIKDEAISDMISQACDQQSLSCAQKEKTDHQVEVQVLQSGQIQFSEANTNADSSVLYTSSERTFETINSNTSIPSTTHLQLPPSATGYHNFLVSKQHNVDYQTVHDNELEKASLVLGVQRQPSVHPHHQSTDVSTQILHSSPRSESRPLILHRNHNHSPGCNTSTKNTHQENTSNQNITISSSSPETMTKSVSNDERNKMQLRRSSRRLSQKITKVEETILERNQNHSLSSDIPLSKRRRIRSSEKVALTLPEQQLLLSNHQRVDHHPAEWCVEEVAEFIKTLPRCNYEEVFREHEVDGESLMSLDPEMMVKLMNIKAGPALKIHRNVLKLKKQYNIST